MMLSDAVEKIKDFQRDGFVHIEGALSSEQASQYSSLLEGVRGQPGWEPDKSEGVPDAHYKMVQKSDSPFMDRRDLLRYHQRFIDLIDTDPVFQFILALMGPHIFLSMAQGIIRSPHQEFAGYTHVDGGTSMNGIVLHERSKPISVKVLYLLTDTIRADCGNFTVFPGSQNLPLPSGMTPYSQGARQLFGLAGDAFVFTHSLWHGPSMNISDTARSTLIYNYSQMFVRQYDYREGDSPFMERFNYTKRQRRLMGDLGHPHRPGAYFYSPLDQKEVMSGG